MFGNVVLGSTSSSSATEELKVNMTSLELRHLTSTLHSFQNEAKRRSLLQKSIDTAKISGDRHAVHTVASVICASDQNLDEFAHLFEDTT